MANLSSVVRQLQSERDRAARELERLDSALAALNHLGGRGNGRRSAATSRGRRARPRFSAAARARMAAAQRARWAKVKQRKPAKAQRRMSAAARRRIAVAQRARWAKLRAGKTQKAGARTAKKQVQKVQASAA